MRNMVSYKILSFYHEISMPFSECRINLELLLRIDFFTHIYTEEQVEKFNKRAREAKSYAFKEAELYLKDTKSSRKLPESKSRMRKEKVTIEVPEFNYDYFKDFIDKSVYHSAFSYYETYMSSIIHYVFNTDKQYLAWSDKEKEDTIIRITNERASIRMKKIQEIVKLNHRFTDIELKGLDRFLTVRNLIVHNGGILKPYHISRLELDRIEIGMEYDFNYAYADIQGLIEFLTFFDELVVRNYPSVPRY